MWNKYLVMFFTQKNIHEGTKNTVTLFSKVEFLILVCLDGISVDVATGNARD